MENYQDPQFEDYYYPPSNNNSSVKIIIVIIIVIIIFAISGYIIYSMNTNNTTTSSNTTPNATNTATNATTIAPTTNTTNTNTTTKKPVASSSTTTTTPTVFNALEGLPTGTSITCNIASPIVGGVFRYMGGTTISHYPSGDIASSWDPSWGSASAYDCTGLTLGAELTSKVTQAPKVATSGLTVGDTVNCSSNDPSSDSGRYYRFIGNNTLSHYGSGYIAGSWDPNWQNDVKQIDCLGVKQNDGMLPKTVSGLTPNVSIVNCNAGYLGTNGSSDYYLYVGGATLSKFSSDQSAKSKDPNYAANSTIINCSELSRGANI
jgi:hypothetical protein